MRRIPDTRSAPSREESPELARKYKPRTEVEPAADAPADSPLVEQLHSMYAEREHLEKRLGVSDAQDIIAMVECLELQLKEFYALKEELEARAKTLRSQLSFVENFV